MSTRKIHNPKAHSPAVYIPVWLCQVPNDELNYSSKLVYGRLAQWATAAGKAHRSAKQLSQELGMPERTVESCLKELRDIKLIGSHQPQEGGHNHFEFYDHEFMHRPINKNLCYQNDNFTPSADVAEPSADVAEPSADVAEHKIKEIKTTTHTHKDDEFEQEKELYFQPDQLQKAINLRKQCLKNEKCLTKYDELPQEAKEDKTLKDILNECVAHYAGNNQLVSPQRFLSWIKRDIEYYKKQKVRKVKESEYDDDDTSWIDEE